MQIEDRFSMIEAEYRTFRDNYYQLMATFCDVLNQENRLIILEDKISCVYDRLVDLAHSEGIVRIESEKWERIASELSVAREDIHKEIRKCAQGLLAAGGYKCHDE